MRTIRDDDYSKTIKPKKKIDAKIKTVRLRANLKLTHWYEKAVVSISAAASRPDEVISTISRRASTFIPVPHVWLWCRQ